jgi:hypothetical protein
MKWRTYRGCHTVAHNISLDCYMPEEEKKMKFRSDAVKKNSDKNEIRPCLFRCK